MMAYLLAVIWPIYISPISDVVAAQRMSILLAGFDNAITFTMVAAPFCAALAVFSYPYKIASAAVFHAFPVNRRQLFFTHLLAGATLFIAPLLILSLIMLIPVPVTQVGLIETNPLLVFMFNTTFSIPIAESYMGYAANPPLQVAVFFLRSALGFMVYYGLFVLAASIAGNRVIAVMLSAAFVLFPIALVGLAETAFVFYIFGHGTIVSHRNIWIVAIYTQPFFWTLGNDIGGFVGSISNLALLISHSLIMLGSLIAAYTAYSLRRQERAGDSVVFTPVKRVLIFLFATAGMILIGVVFFSAMGARVWLYIGFVAGFIIAYFAAQMIAEKTFRVGDKAKQLIPYIGVMVVAYALMLLVINIGLWGYVRRVPEINDIARVHIRDELMWPHEPSHDVWANSFTDDPATTRRVQELHQDILAERRNIQRLSHNPRLQRLQERTGFFGIVIAYQLNNGQIVSRTYALPHSLYRELGAMELMQSYPVRLANNTLLNHPDDINFIELTMTPQNIRQEMRTLEDAIDEATRDGLSAEVTRLHRIRFDLTTHSQARALISDRADISDLAQALINDIIYTSPPAELRVWDNSINVNVYSLSEARHRTVRLNMPDDGYVAAWARDNGILGWDEE